MVYLVGAGPGDPGLITVKALELIGRADVILYDRLIDPLLLFNARADCTLVDVGKRSGCHTRTQDEITGLLVEYGRRDIEVVRLKGGDPFLFGRGAEEAERLADEGIPFAVVPGVSALTAVTAYSGIPLTHRKYSSSFGAATGHAAESKDTDSVRLRKMTEGVDTIVLFMGVGNLEPIVMEILEGGRSPETPAALIERGTTPAQRLVTGTLANITGKAVSEKISPPALLVVGETVKCAGKLAWYSPGPLAGLRIGVTRPYAQSRSFAMKLAALGAEPVIMPTIETVETTETPAVIRAMNCLELFDYIVFSSANGVNAFFGALGNAKKDARQLAGKSLAVIGPSTGKTLERHGIRADITAETFVAEGLLEAILNSSNVAGMRFLVVRSDTGRATLAEGLRKAGAFSEEVSFYSTRASRLAPHVLDCLRGGGLDIITFTSSSTVHGLFGQISTNTLGADIKLASIGPQTTKALIGYGRTPDIEAAEYTTEGLANAILTRYTETT